MENTLPGEVPRGPGPVDTIQDVCVVRDDLSNGLLGCRSLLILCGAVTEKTYTVFRFELVCVSRSLLVRGEELSTLWNLLRSIVVAHETDIDAVKRGGNQPSSSKRVDSD